MRTFGFSTGALAFGDFRRGIDLLRRRQVRVVELSALRESELPELVQALPTLDLTSFAHVSVHAPSAFPSDAEHQVVSMLTPVLDLGIPIVVHPDTISDWAAWRSFGGLLFVENMDKRKPIGRTAVELERVFSILTEANLCLDLGHARQVDPTMSECAEILRLFGSRLRQIHISEVNTNSRHDHLTVGAVLAFRKMHNLIPDQVPIVLESRVSEGEILNEIARAAEALPLQNSNGILVAQG